MRAGHVWCAAAGALLALAVGSEAASALDGKAIVESQCRPCHNLTGPAPSDFRGVLERKAPDLFYAGSKFNRAWLVAWLRKPTPIRPAGMMYLNHIVTEDGKDRIDADTVKPCPAALDPQAAEAVADHLMTLTDATMRPGIVDPAKKFSAPKALRLFRKQLPCVACHAIKAGNRTIGGVSAPSLTDAGARLNPDWIYARIENPQYWDPKTWMPRLEMTHEKRELLTLLIATMR